MIGAAVTAGAKDDDVDRINVRDNVINAFAGEKKARRYLRGLMLVR